MSLGKNNAPGLNYHGIAWNRLDDGTPIEIWQTEGADFQTIKPKNTPNAVNLYKVIEIAIKEGLIVVEGETEITEGEGITITGSGTSDDPYIINGQVISIASDIISTPLGNLTSENVQDALNELQTDIDNIAMSGGTNIYLADGTVIGQRTVDLDGNSISFTDGGASALIEAAQMKLTGMDFETNQAIIQHDANGERWSHIKTVIGSTITTKL